MHTPHIVRTCHCFTTHTVHPPGSLKSHSFSLAACLAFKPLHSFLNMHLPLLLAFASHAEAPMHLGCYVDNESRMLPISLGNVNSASGCYYRARAAGYRYFAMQLNTYCFAGNDVARATSLGVGDGCVACNGDASQQCGGTWRNSLYGPGMCTLVSFCNHASQADHGNSA